MNILFFLIPKSEVAYIFEDETLRQTLEKMEHRKYSCIPILTMDGKYLGTISEGDLLWACAVQISTTSRKQKESRSWRSHVAPPTNRSMQIPIWKISWIAPLIRTSYRWLMTRLLHRDYNQKIYHQILLQRNKSRTENCR